MQAYLSDEDYNFIYSRSPRVCVDLLIKNSNGEVFLTKREIEPYKDHWHLPGGRIRFRETIPQALERIAKSELGYNIEGPVVLLGVCEFLDESQNGNDRHSISLVHQLWYSNEPLTGGSFFSSLPKVIIPEQKDFMLSNNLI
jgi:ADP-ribose pyrophosphatase YjhB (NUDIX family)